MLHFSDDPILDEGMEDAQSDGVDYINLANIREQLEKCVKDHQDAQFIPQRSHEDPIADGARRIRKSRNKFSQEAHDRLNAVFQLNCYPTCEQVVDLADELKCDTKVVQNWFMNRRYAQKQGPRKKKGRRNQKQIIDSSNFDDQNSCSGISNNSSVDCSIIHDHNQSPQDSLSSVSVGEQNEI